MHRERVAGSNPVLDVEVVTHREVERLSRRVAHFAQAAVTFGERELSLLIDAVVVVAHGVGVAGATNWSESVEGCRRFAS